MSFRTTFFGLLVITLVLAIASLGVGPARLPLSAVLHAVLGNADETTRIIVWDIRLPRTLLAIMIGAMLGVAGAALQALTRNPLADPTLFGAPQAAAFSTVALVSYAGVDLLSFTAPMAGIAGAILSVAALIVLSGRNAPMLLIILAGVAISSLAGALTALAINLAPNFFAALEITFWLMGSLADRSMRHVWLALPFILAGMCILLWAAPRLRAMILGDDVAESLGVAVRPLRLLIILAVALGVGAGVAVSGAIGFIGLVAPHLVRPLVGHDPAKTVYAAAPAGAALLLLADLAVRLAPATSDLKVGVLTALVGAPFFLFLISRGRRSLAGDMA